MNANKTFVCKTYMDMFSVFFGKYLEFLGHIISIYLTL